MVVEHVTKTGTKDVLTLRSEAFQVIEESTVRTGNLSDVAKKSLSLVEWDDGGVAILCECTEGDCVLLMKDIDASHITTLCVDELLNTTEKAGRVNLGRFTGCG